MKWLAIALCVALFCVGLIQSEPAKDSSEELKKVSSKVKRAVEGLNSKVKLEAAKDKPKKAKRAVEELNSKVKLEAAKDKAKKAKREAKGDEKKDTVRTEDAFKTEAKKT
ncbi:hypothetical protein ANCCAN_15909 [Ancylostoma caninum]|uniref:Uncharacterized protein n=1 Tax=Ancylostoma caninum TaxID=29170 RepID=A0A368G5C5_ANCCA|nr:hypothetical protein ANCCAN_15909 [Ancylostoma caninum]